MRQLVWAKSVNHEVFAPLPVPSSMNRSETGFSNLGNSSLLLIGGDKDWLSPLTTEHAWKITSASRVVSFNAVIWAQAWSGLCVLAMVGHLESLGYHRSESTGLLPQGMPWSSTNCSSGCWLSLQHTWLCRASIQQRWGRGKKLDITSGVLSLNS